MDKNIFKTINRNLFENYSSRNNNYRFSLLDQKGEPLHEYFMCKDYYTDMLYCQTNGVSFSVYGYIAKKKDKQQFLLEPGLFNIALCYGCDSLTTKEFVPDNTKINPENLQKCLNELEEIYGFEPSLIKQNDDYIIISSDTAWLQIPWLSSFYFLLLRVGNNYAGDGLKQFFESYSSKYSGSDASYITTIVREKLIDEILSNSFSSSNFFIGELSHKFPSMIHNNLGTVNFTQWRARESFVSANVVKFENKKTIKEIIEYSKELNPKKSIRKTVAA